MSKERGRGGGEGEGEVLKGEMLLRIQPEMLLRTQPEMLLRIQLKGVTYHQINIAQCARNLWRFD